MSATFLCSAQEFMIHSLTQDRKKIILQKSVEIVRIVECIHKYKVQLSNPNTYTMLVLIFTIIFGVFVITVKSDSTYKHSLEPTSMWDNVRRFWKIFTSPKIYSKYLS